LLKADAAQLTRIVPVGCRLLDAASHYTAVQVVSGDGGATVTASVAMAPARLVCHGRVRSHTPASAPARLEIKLRSTAAGARIVGVRHLRE
jgi:hypothetical protein